MKPFSEQPFGAFDVLVTVVKNILSSENLKSLKIAILILIANSNRYEDLDLSGLERWSL